MTNRKTTRRALVLSLLSLLLCCSMLVGTTFAWFTDSVQSGNNQIVAGNLDVELYHSDKTVTDEKVTESTLLFDDIKLWEPGVVAWENLKVANEGTLALKYELSINFDNATETPEGKTLADVLKVAFVKGGVDGSKTREEMVAGITSWGEMKSFVQPGKLEAGTTAPTTDTYGIVIWWEPGANDNDFNMNNGNQALELSIDLGINLFATQVEAELDSFGSDYDKPAPELTVEVNPNNIQEYLDGQHGDLANMTLKLAAGNYGVLYLGRPTKYAGSNTEYYCGTHEFTTDDAETFKAHLAEAGYHTTPKYTTTLKDLTIEGADGATVAGAIVTTGHSYGDVYDYVLDKDYDSGSAYYSTLTMKNVTFKNVAFSGKVDINTSDADTVYDGVTFDGCSFANTSVAALRYYNEANNGKVRNLTVKNSTFTDVYQGVYVHHVSGVTVTGNTFDTTGHNAIALQNHDGAIDLKKVVISNNTFKNIGDRVVRFGNIGADSDITMEYNVATNSGDDDGEVMKATSVAAGVKVTANYNSWGGTVVNLELRDTKTCTFVDDTASLYNALKAGGTVVLTDDITLTETKTLDNVDFVLDGNGHIITQDASCVNTYALFDITGGTAAVKNVTFDGIKGGAVIRTVGAKLDVDKVTVQNCNITQVQGLLRLLGESTITNSTFKNNTCNMLISLNYDGANNDPQIVKNCVFEGNTCNDVAVVYYVEGAGATIDGNKFLNNTVKASAANGNGATVYMGFTENNVVTNNVFDGNSVTTTTSSKRVAGALMVGYETVITGNAFINNTATAEDGHIVANDVCASVYYTNIDLSGNYWGGGAPVENDDYFVEYPTEGKVIINDYLTTYSN